MRASPQLSLFSSDATGDAGVWAERLSRAVRRSEAPIRVPGTRRVGGWRLSWRFDRCSRSPPRRRFWTRAPERALVFLKRISKRFSATQTDHLLQALALFQGRKAFGGPGAVGAP